MQKMKQYNSIRVRRLANAAVDVASLALPSYGSLKIAELELLEDELGDFIRSGSGAACQRSLVLDLGEKKPLGAGFLSVLERMRAAAVENGRIVILAGDDGGLLAAVGWLRRFPHFPELREAINAAARRLAYSSAN